MKLKATAILASAIVLMGCEGPITDWSIDQGTDAKGLENLKAGIWVDPIGCEHWIIDDGIEGYMSQRLKPNGKPVCSTTAERMSVQGDFKQGSAIPDIF